MRGERMRAVALWRSVDLPMGPRNACLWGHEKCEGCAEWAWGTHAGGGDGAFGGAPYGATKGVRRVLKCVWVMHAGGSTGTFGGAPYGATKRVRVVLRWVMMMMGGRRRGRRGGRNAGRCLFTTRAHYHRMVCLMSPMRKAKGGS